MAETNRQTVYPASKPAKTTVPVNDTKADQWPFPFPNRVANTASELLIHSTEIWMPTNA